MLPDSSQEWKKYCSYALTVLGPLLSQLGYILEKEQPHLSGERSFIRSITGGRKLVLIGVRIQDGKRVIIKASNELLGMQEIEHERMCRQVLNRIKFAYQTFHSPRELAYTRKNGFRIAITEFIEQEMSFLDRPLPEQFRFALSAFKAQESAHATTHAHAKLVMRTFGEMCAATYLKQARNYEHDIQVLVPVAVAPKLNARVAEAINALSDGAIVLDQYGGFLTHWDFTPQNVRIRGDTLYFLDHSSLRFGNKYEGWARFINFMMLYHPLLADVLLSYVRRNRTCEEISSLRLMRLFRLLELIRYYAKWLPEATGDLATLTRARIVFWTEALSSVLDGTTLSSDLIQDYKKTRDRLRSNEEKKRQRGLH